MYLWLERQRAPVERCDAGRNSWKLRRVTTTQLLLLLLLFPGIREKSLKQSGGGGLKKILF